MLIFFLSCKAVFNNFAHIVKTNFGGKDVHVLFYSCAVLQLERHNCFGVEYHLKIYRWVQKIDNEIKILKKASFKKDINHKIWMAGQENLGIVIFWFPEILGWRVILVVHGDLVYYLLDCCFRQINIVNCA